MWKGENHPKIAEDIANSIIFYGLTDAEEAQEVARIYGEIGQMSKNYQMLSNIQNMYTCTMNTISDNIGGGSYDYAGNRISPPGCPP